MTNQTQCEVVKAALEAADWASAQHAIAEYLRKYPQAAMSWVEWLESMAKYGRELKAEGFSKDEQDAWDAWMHETLSIIDQRIG